MREYLYLCLCVSFPLVSQVLIVAYYPTLNREFLKKC